MERALNKPLLIQKDSPLVANLKKEKELLQIGDLSHQSIRTGFLADSGLMHGVYGGGVVTGFEKMGYQDSFDLLVGVSTGSAIVSYFMTGQSRIGTSIYY